MVGGLGLGHGAEVPAHWRGSADPCPLMLPSERWLQAHFAWQALLRVEYSGSTLHRQDSCCPLLVPSAGHLHSSSVGQPHFEQPSNEKALHGVAL